MKKQDMFKEGPADFCNFPIPSTLLKSIISLRKVSSPYFSLGEKFVFSTLSHNTCSHHWIQVSYLILKKEGKISHYK